MIEMMYSTKDTADLLSVTVRAIENWRLKGKLKPLKAGGRCRYTESELKRFLGISEPVENENEGVKGANEGD
jgi:predicted site-specific integrase-resolvase